ncbi:MAG: AAA family ATPase [Thermoplasmata archaeon]|nr:MAG: AAA family ATPase [Thermoplasmata archaeon]
MRIQQEEARPARFLKLKPVGFPLRDSQKNYIINIKDRKLFEIYAKEQWMGMIVKEGDYLFDQRIIPDFAFKVTRVLPRGEVMITEDTKIEVEKRKYAPFKIIPNYSFDDIIGHEKVKQKCRIIMEYLRNPKKFGEWAPKNILFYGPPGTGKTMTAKALAKETASSLFLVRATDLIGEYVGESSKKIHELFSIAMENVPSVIFIDELDAIGLDRGYQSIRGDVSEIVNALLTELEGVRENKGIVTIAATNVPTMLDPALRSRFEEEIEFKLPSSKERLEILEHYAKKLPLKLNADLKKYVSKTEGFSGRDLKEKLLKVALHRAILRGASEITEKDIDEALKCIKPISKSEPKEMFF